jgi:hypothetical protein
MEKYLKTVLKLYQYVNGFLTACKRGEKGRAARRPALFSPIHRTKCHSERSEESLSFSAKQYQSSLIRSFLFGILIFMSFQSSAEQPTYQKTISQYGISWEFEKPMLTGQFITGDWWVRR